MNENEICGQALKKLFGRLGREGEISIHIASYLQGVMDVIDIVKRSEANQ